MEIFNVSMCKLNWNLSESKLRVDGSDIRDIYTSEFSISAENLLLFKVEFRLCHYQTYRGSSNVSLMYSINRDPYWNKSNLHFDSIKEGEDFAEKILEDILIKFRSILESL